MTERELEQRLRAWYRGEVGDDAAPATLRASLAAIPAVAPAAARSPLTAAFRSRRGLLLLAAVVLLGAATALAIGNLLRQDGPGPLAVVRDGAIYVVTADQADRQIAVIDQAEEVIDVQWSPDNRQISLQVRLQVRLAGRDELWVINADGSGRRLARATSGWWPVGHRWAPDGQHIAAWEQEPGGNAELRIIEVETGQASAPLATIPPAEWPYTARLQWSSDGARIAYFLGGTPALEPSRWVPPQLWVVDANGESPAQLVEQLDDCVLDEQRWLAWPPPCESARNLSPDLRTTVALVYSDDAQKQKPMLEIREADGSTPPLVEFDSSFAEVDLVSWSPNGQHIAYTGFWRTSGGGSSLGGGISIVGADGSSQEQVSGASADALGWSTDGRWLIWLEAGSTAHRLMVYDTVEHATRVMLECAAESCPGWSIGGELRSADFEMAYPAFDPTEDCPNAVVAGSAIVGGGWTAGPAGGPPSAAGDGLIATFEVVDDEVGHADRVRLDIVLIDPASGGKCRLVDFEGGWGGSIWDTFAGFAWSPDGNALAMGWEGDLYVWSPSGLAMPQADGVATENGNTAAPFGWSPDGQHLAVRGSDNSLSILHADASPLTSLGGICAGDPCGGFSTPLWSPDGSRIALSVWRSAIGPYAGNRSQIAILSEAGRWVSAFDSDEDLEPEAWIDNATLLAWADQDGDPSLVTISIGRDGEIQDIEELLGAESLDGEWAGRLSPDRSLAATVACEVDVGRCRLVLTEVASGRSRDVATARAISGQLWAPNGASISFWALDPETPDRAQARRSGWWMVNVDGTGLRQVSPEAPNLGAVWQPVWP